MTEHQHPAAPNRGDVPRFGSRLSRLDDLLATGRRSYSFEFAPPRDDSGREALWRTIDRIQRIHPTFVSVTYGAGGAMGQRLARTMEVTDHLATATDLALVAHLTCVGASRTEIADVISRFADADIVNVLALRGDPPEGPSGTWIRHPDGLDYALELIAMLAEHGGFCLGVAAFPYRHPASPDVEHDARILAMKSRAGASFAISQLFFDVEPYLELVERSTRHGSSMPIIPGIMPITSLAQIERFAELSGTPVPRRLVSLLERAGSPQDVRSVGIEWSTQLSAQLLAEGAPGLHFYTLNRSTATMEIYSALGLADGSGS